MDMTKFGLAPWKGPIQIRAAVIRSCPRHGRVEHDGVFCTSCEEGLKMAADLTRQPLESLRHHLRATIRRELDKSPCVEHGALAHPNMPRWQCPCCLAARATASSSGRDQAAIAAPTPPVSDGRASYFFHADSLL